MHGWNDETTAHVLKTVNLRYLSMVIVVVQWLSHVQLFATPQTTARQASLSFTISQIVFYFTLLFLFHFGGLRRIRF